MAIQYVRTPRTRMLLCLHLVMHASPQVLQLVQTRACSWCSLALERRIASLEGDMQTIKALSSSVSFMSDSSNPALRQQPVASPVHGLAMPAASKPSSTEVVVKKSSHALHRGFNPSAHLPEVDNPLLPSTQTQRAFNKPCTR